MTIFRKTLGMVGLLLLVVAFPVVGQENNAFVPYERLYMVCVDAEINIFTPYGDVCSWSPGEDTLRRETTGEYIGELSISPDGTKAVYLTLPDDYVEAVLAGEDPTNIDGIFVLEDDTPPSRMWEMSYGFGAYPTNIGILDLTASSPSDEGRFEIVAEQVIPPDIDMYSTQFQRRLLPIWSPDSTQIAWIEENLETQGYDGHIVVYDTVAGTTQVVDERVSLGWTDGNDSYRLPELLGWGSAIAYGAFNAREEADTPADVSRFGYDLSLYMPDGEALGMSISYFNSYEDQLRGVKWVLHRDTWWVEMYYVDYGWVVFDPVNDVYELLENPSYIQAITRTGWIGYVDTTVSPVQNIWLREDRSVQGEGRGFPTTFTPEGSPLWVNAELGFITLDQAGEVVSILPIVNGALTITRPTWTPLIWLTDGIGTPVEPAIAVD